MKSLTPAHTEPAPARRRSQRSGLPACVSALGAAWCVLPAASSGAEESPAVPEPAFVSKSWQIEDGLPSNTIVDIAKTPDGYLWLGTRNGVVRFDGVRFKSFGLKDGLENPHVFALGQEIHGDVWVATVPNGLYRFHEGKFLPVAGPPEYPRITAWCLWTDRAGNLWVGCKGKLLCWGDGHWRVYGKEQGLPAAFMLRLAQTADGTIWASAAALTKQPGSWEGPVNAVFGGHEGDLWLGSFRSGLTRLTRTKVATCGGQGFIIHSVAESGDGVLWAGTSGMGLRRVAGGRLQPGGLGDETGRFRGVNSVLPTPDGDLWLGMNGGLMRSQQGGAASPFGVDQFMRGDEVWALCEDGAGGVWVGTYFGRLLRAHQEQLTLVTDQLGGHPVTAFAPEPNGGLWIGTSGSLFRLRDGAISVFTKADGLLDAYIQALYRNPEGTLWIGTYGGGLSCWKEGRIATFTTAEGLPDDVISQIIRDDAGDYWFGRSRGIFRLRQDELFGLLAGTIRVVHPLLLGRAEGMAFEGCTGGYYPSSERWFGPWSVNA